MDAFDPYAPPAPQGRAVAERDPSALPHSGLGIASFVVAGLAFVAEVGLLVAAGVLEASRPGGVDENSPEAMVLGLLMMGGMGVALLGAGLGLAGLFQPGRRRVFGALGLAFNGLILLGGLSLIALALVMG